MRRSWKQLWRLHQRRFCVGLMLVAYLLTVSGVFVPASTKKLGGVPFPCQDHECGCQSAEQCWTSCCCFTPAQHLAWAKEHKVEPPAYAFLPENSNASPTSQLVHEAEEAGHHCDHCAAGETPEAPACSHPFGHEDITGLTSLCCQKDSGLEFEKTQAKPATGIRWMLGITVLSCRGSSTMWVTSGSVGPPPLASMWSPAMATTERIRMPELEACPLLTPPPDPPPRHLAAI
jgi:hypothetical protein